MLNKGESQSSNNTQIWLAVIGLIGALGVALICNWDKIFPHKTVPSTAPAPTTSDVLLRVAPKKIKNDAGLTSVPGASGKTPPATPLAAQQTDLTLAPTLASADFGSEAESSPIEKAEVEALVADWQAAQNRGDFAAYRYLYAARMTGIKRVGAHVLEYDRDGWLADRARMFEHPMKVHVADIQVRATKQSAVARFNQSFAQGKFHDFGPKQMVVVREGGGLRIAREEMLESVVLGRAEKAP